MSVAAVIVAAGSGSRAGGERPKQYQEIGGKPVLRWTLEAFARHPSIARIAVVINPEHREMYQEAAQGLAIESTVSGGATRQESCRLGIAALVPFAPAAVLVHDAARPFVTPVVIDRVIAALDSHSGAIPGLAVADTLKRAPGRLIEATVDRTDLWSVQTPQGFAFTAIHEAHRRAAAAGLNNLTDDAAVAEWAGLEVVMVDGDPLNRKLTSAADLAEADRTLRHLMQSQLPDIRIGQGIDFHAFEPGDGVVLCGVTIPHDRKLRGHSDADAALHALTDALLGAIGEGDIGTHFPPSDPQWKGASSHVFVEKAVGLIARRGGRIAHADLTILAEAPRITPHVPAMKALLCPLLGLTPDRLAIKATTTEHMGFIGRREGLAAFATATVRLPA